MEKQQNELIERALKQLGAKEFPELKSARRLESVLAEGHKTGKLDEGELRAAARDLVEEADVPKRLASESDGRHSDVAFSSGIAVLFLLLLLYLLLALLPEDSDVQYAIRDLIDKLLGRA